MKKLHFSYEMQIEYAEDVARCNFTIKCIPKSTSRQMVHDYDIKLFPATGYCVGRDGLKNLQIYGVNEIAHKIFNFKIEGDVTTGLSDFEEEVDGNLAMIFNHPYGLNRAGETIKQFHKENSVDDSLTEYEKTVKWMHILHKKFHYKPCTTNVDTSAEDAFAQGCGVCQDYAHIFIALLHLEKIPARYVTGLIVGEGASHAWVEILWNDKWYGFDPTNNQVVGDDYIKLGVGRDAKDCMINRGIMHGGGLHTQTINVSVRENKK